MTKDTIPARIELRKAVQQRHHRSVDRASVDDIEHQLAAAVLLHALCVLVGQQRLDQDGAANSLVLEDG